jgi:hypothetical protein
MRGGYRTGRRGLGYEDGGDEIYGLLGGVFYMCWKGYWTVLRSHQGGKE